MRWDCGCEFVNERRINICEAHKNENTLYALMSTNDPNDRLVAEDLANELGCGLPSRR